MAFGHPNRNDVKDVAAYIAMLARAGIKYNLWSAPQFRGQKYIVTTEMTEATFDSSGSLTAIYDHY